MDLYRFKSGILSDIEWNLYEMDESNLFQLIQHFPGVHPEFDCYLLNVSVQGKLPIFAKMDELEKIESNPVDPETEIRDINNANGGEEEQIQTTEETKPMEAKM